MTSTTYNVSELPQIAQSLLQDMPNTKVFCFYGAMGTGKTTLIKKLLANVGATHTGNSPTFSLVNEHYNASGEVLAYHFDLYRLETEEEAYDIGIEDYFKSNAHLFIEWPERIPNLLPEGHLAVTLQFIDDTTRIIEF